MGSRDGDFMDFELANNRFLQRIRERSDLREILTSAQQMHRKALLVVPVDVSLEEFDLDGEVLARHVLVQNTAAHGSHEFTSLAGDVGIFLTDDASARGVTEERLFPSRYGLPRDILRLVFRPTERNASGFPADVQSFFKSCRELQPWRDDTLWQPDAKIPPPSGLFDARVLRCGSVEFVAPSSNLFRTVKFTVPIMLVSHPLCESASAAASNARRKSSVSDKRGDTASTSAPASSSDDGKNTASSLGMHRIRDFLLQYGLTTGPLPSNGDEKPLFDDDVEEGTSISGADMQDKSPERSVATRDNRKLEVSSDSGDEAAGAESTTAAGVARVESSSASSSRGPDADQTRDRPHSPSESSGDDESDKAIDSHGGVVRDRVVRPVFTFQSFLDKLRESAASDVVRRIKGFIRVFIDDYASLKQKPSSYRGGKVCRFVSEMEERMSVHSLWANACEEELENVGEGLEKLVLTKLYTTVFGSDGKVIAEDLELDDKLEVLSFLEPDHLEVPPEIVRDRSWSVARAEILKINSYKAPRDKIVCVLNCCRVLNSILARHHQRQGKSPPGADEFLPVLIFMILFARPPHLHANIDYVQSYRHPDRLRGEAAYYFTNFISAVHFLSHIEARYVNMPEEEFRTRCDAALSRISMTPPAKMRFLHHHALSVMPHEIPALLHEYKRLAHYVGSLSTGTDASLRQSSLAQHSGALAAEMGPAKRDSAKGSASEQAQVSSSDESQRADPKMQQSSERNFGADLLGIALEDTPDAEGSATGGSARSSEVLGAAQAPRGDVGSDVSREHCECETPTAPAEDTAAREERAEQHTCGLAGKADVERSDNTTVDADTSSLPDPQATENGSLLY